MAKHYVTGEFPKRAPVRLNDEEYGRCLDAIVKACVDVVIVHSRTKQVLLGNRRVHPQPGLWFIGGRMIPGESPEETAARHVRHDTTLALPPSSFSFVCVSSYLWAMRHQPPAENGTADIALTYFCFVDDEQAARIECGNKAEYAEGDAFNWHDLLATAALPTIHPALRDALIKLASLVL